MHNSSARQQRELFFNLEQFFQTEQFINTQFFNTDCRSTHSGTEWFFKQNDSLTKTILNIKFSLPSAVLPHNTQQIITLYKQHYLQFTHVENSTGRNGKPNSQIESRFSSQEATVTSAVHANQAETMGREQQESGNTITRRSALGVLSAHESFWWHRKWHSWHTSSSA